MIGILLSYTGTLIIRAIAWSRQLSDLTATNLMKSRRRQRRARQYLSVTSNCLVNYILDLANNLVLLVVPGEYPDFILKRSISEKIAQTSLKHTGASRVTYPAFIG